MNLNGVQNCIQMSTKKLSGIVIVRKIKLQNTVGMQITTLPGFKKTIHSVRNPNHINKMSYMLSEIWLPNLG